MNFKDVINMHVGAIGCQKIKSDFYNNVSHFMFWIFNYKIKSIFLKCDPTEKVTSEFWKLENKDASIL